MPTTPHFKGIIFDLDGTLAFSQEVHDKAYGQFFKPHGIEYSEKKSKPKYAGRGGMKNIPEIFAEHGITVSVEETKKYLLQKDAIFDQMVQKEGIGLVPGVKEFLNYCKQKGISIIVATGARRETALYVLRTTGLLEYFPEIVTVEDVENPKPAPDIFLLAAQKLNLKPQECVVIEDAVSGIEGAKNGNFFCIGITTGASEWQLKQSGADMIIEDYKGLQTKNIF